MPRGEVAEEIAFELGQLRQVAEVASRLSAVAPEQRRPWDSAAAAKYITDLVLGLENLCKRRYAHLRKAPPSGPDSHSRVLDEFLQEPDLGARLPAAVAHRLKLYLRFRHRFFHGYGHEVKWEIAEEPLRLLPETVAALADVWEHWLTTR